MKQSPPSTCNKGCYEPTGGTLSVISLKKLSPAYWEDINPPPAYRVDIKSPIAYRVDIKSSTAYSADIRPSAPDCVEIMLELSSRTDSLIAYRTDIDPPPDHRVDIIMRTSLPAPLSSVTRRLVTDPQDVCVFVCVYIGVCVCVCVHCKATYSCLQHCNTQSNTATWGPEV